MERIEVLYDKENLSNEEWIKIIQEVELIDSLLTERGHKL